MEELNKKFALTNGDNYLRFKKGSGDIPVVEIRNAHASATISMQGAHVLSWVPHGEEEVIWLSEDAKFAPGKSVRGGIPICWPWFGAHESNQDFPAHGFARTTNWEIICTEVLEDSTTRITFTTEPQSNNEHMWPPETTVQYQLTIGKRLEMELITRNNGTRPIVISQALHTYFNVGDISNAYIHGLDKLEYLDKLESFKQKQQLGPVIIEEEIDRIYLKSTGDCVIEDKALKRNIVIIKCGSRSTVVWNPWQETANKMGDLGKEGYKKMLCVESSNAAEDEVTIEPGKAHQLWVQYEVLKTEE